MSPHKSSTRRVELAASRGRRAIFTFARLAAFCGSILALVATIPYQTARSYVDRFAQDGGADPYTSGLHARLQLTALLSGLLLAVVAAALGASCRRLSPHAAAAMRRLQRDAGQVVRWMRCSCRELAPAVLGLALLGLAVRLPYIDQPIRFDEAHTFLEYVVHPWFVAVSRYDAPNNHVLHSWCVLVSTRLLGEGLPAIRLPALVAGVALIPATMLLARAASGRTAAVYAGLLTAVSSPLIEYSTSARGYTLLCLLTVTGWLAVLAAAPRGNLAAWGIWCVTAAAGCWTVPVMVYPLSMQLVWLAMRSLARRGWTSRRLLLRRMVGAALLAGMATFVLYIPVLIVAGPGAILANRYVSPLPRSEFWAGLPSWLLHIAQALTRDLPAPAVIILSLAVLFACRPGSTGGRLRLLALISLLAPLGMVLIQSVHPYSRVFLFLIPPALVLAAAGLGQAVSRLNRPGFRYAFHGAVLLVLGVWPLLNVVARESVLKSDEGGALPEAEQIILDLAPVLESGEPIIAISPATQQLVYYSRRHGLPAAHFEWPGSARTRSDCGVVVAHRSWGQSLTDVLSALDLDDTLEGLQFEVLREYPHSTVYRAAPQ